MADFPAQADRYDWSFPAVFQQIEQYVNEGVNRGLTVYEEGDKIIVEAAMPGISSDDINIGLNNGLLVIRGEKKVDEQGSDKKYIRKSDRSYSYSVMLDKKIDESIEPKATYKDGILKIVFVKAKATEAKKIPIKVE